jgi:hypothetical protein
VNILDPIGTPTLARAAHSQLLPLPVGQGAT